MTIRTEGVRTLALGPVSGDLEVVIDGEGLGHFDLSNSHHFRREGAGNWQTGSFDLSREKHHGASGPIGDLFHEGLIMVPGTAGTKEESFFTNWTSNDASGYYRSRNGGVHRGGIQGRNDVELARAKDSDLSDEDLETNNLLLYGTHATNSVLERLGGGLPITFDGDTIHLADRSFTAENAAVFATFPHPGNPDRYVAVHGGVTPDAVCWGSHLDMALLPDCLVYAGGEMLEWGFLGNDWKCQD
jgi:hypothetical protein